MRLAIAPLALALALTTSITFAAGPIQLFNGKNLDGWSLRGDKAKSKWTVGIATMDEQDNAKLAVKEAAAGKGELVNPASGVDIYTSEKFGDCTLSLELMVPKGSNSGIYMLGEYEVQILDSYGKAEVTKGDLGGIYNTAAPKKNASKKPGEWQSMVIEFKAPRFEGDKKVANAKFVKVILNGETIHENVEVAGPTPACLTGKESPTGPVMFQGDHGAVALRNIQITPKK
jgi:hypothetical protein